MKSILLLMVALPAFAQTLSVCEVMSRLTELNGKVISVRGVWATVDAREVLVAEAPCTKPTIRDGWQWRDWIVLTPLQGQTLPGRDRDKRSELLKKSPGSVVLATVTGMLETRERFTIRVDKDGDQTPMAFNGLVAQLRFERAAELVVKPAAEIPAAVWSPDYLVKRVP